MSPRWPVTKAPPCCSSPSSRTGSGFPRARRTRPLPAVAVAVNCWHTAGGKAHARYGRGLLFRLLEAGWHHRPPERHGSTSANDRIVGVVNETAVGRRTAVQQWYDTTKPFQAPWETQSPSPTFSQNGHNGRKKCGVGGGSVSDPD